MFNLSNKTYDILKWVVTILMPALAALYMALASIFGWPYGEEVSATVMAFVMFLSAFVQANSAAYAVRTPQMTDMMFIAEPYLFQMSKELYDTLKWIVQVALPAVSVAYMAMAEIWGLGLTAEVTGVTAALVAFLSAILQISSTNFQKAHREPPF